MSNDWYTLEELARQLGRDQREIDRLASRGRIPGRKVGGEWQFHPLEITQWLEREMREYTDGELAVVEESNVSEEATAEIPVSSLLVPDTIEVPLQARTKRSVLESLVEVAGRTWHVWEPAVVLQAVREREDQLSTTFPGGVALPHPRNPMPEQLGRSVVAFGRTSTTIPFGGADGAMTDLFFLVLCRDTRTHLKVLARLGRLVMQDEFLDRLREAGDENDAYAVITEFDARVNETARR